MRKKLIILLLVVFVIPNYIFSEGLTAELNRSKPEIINTEKYILYLPSDINPNKNYPIVVAFSPTADAQSMIYAWKTVSEKFKWIILASKEFKNGSTTPILPSTVSILSQIIAKFPVDKSKVIATGLSGGGMCAYFFAFEYPELISAVVSNVGRIHPVIINREEGYSYIEGKIAVFMASPTDFNYKYMKEDQKFLDSLDWKTKWIEFEGGHRIAPDFVFEQAAKWLEEQWSGNK